MLKPTWIKECLKRKKEKRYRPFDRDLLTMLNLVNELLTKARKEGIPGPIVHGVLLFMIKVNEEELAKLGTAREPAQAVIERVVKTLSEPFESAA